MADALDSGSSGSNPLQVQVLLSAPKNFSNKLKFFIKYINYYWQNGDKKVSVKYNNKNEKT